MNDRAGLAERPRPSGRPRLDPDQPSVSVSVRLPEHAADALIKLAAKYDEPVSATARRLVLLTLK